MTRKKDNVCLTVTEKVDCINALGSYTEESRCTDEISIKQKIFACWVFLCLGMTNFYSYSAILNAANSIEKYIYPDSVGIADSITAAIMTADFVVISILSFTGSLKSLIPIGLAAMAFASLSLLLVTQYVKGHLGNILFHILCVIVGGGSALSAGASFTLANGFRLSLFPTVLSSGGGFTGIFTFGLWMILSSTMSHDSRSMKNCVATMLGIGVALSFVTLCLLMSLLRSTWVKKFLEETKRMQKAATLKSMQKILTQQIDDNQSTIGREDQSKSFYSTKLSMTARFAEWKAVFAAVYPAVIFAFVSLFLTYSLFPVVGPNHWRINISVKDKLTGIFQVGDFCGRFLPAFSYWIPWLIPSIKNASSVAALRLTLVVTFWLTRYLPDVDLFGALWFQCSQMFLLAASSGWAATVAMIHSPRYIRNRDRMRMSKASALGMLGILAGISTGQWTSYFLKNI